MENETLKALIESVRGIHPHAEITVIEDLFQKELVHFTIAEDKRKRGFGSDRVSVTAFRKAYSEFVERKTFLSLAHQQKTSNGFAVHLNDVLAKENAFYELVERDALLCSWLAKVPPCWITDEALIKLAGPKILETRSCLRARKLDFKIGFQAQTGDVFTVVGALFSPEGLMGMAIDCKAGKDIPALISAALDGISFWATIIMNRLDQTGIILINDQGQGDWEPSSHFEYYLDKSYLPNWFLSGAQEVLHLKPFDVHFIEHSISMECAWDLKCVQASSSNFIDYYVGPTPQNNELIIRRMKENFQNLDTFNDEIHPLA